jgi:tetratricopeptide (TPR) repeat protein
VEAAEAVCEEPLALDYLAQLREASLVLAEEGAGEMRFSMLETLREYGQEQLCAQEHAAAQQRHAQFFTALAARTQPEIVELVNVRANLERWDAELENLRAALRWCHTSSSGEAGAELGLQLAEMVWHYRRMRGYWREGLTDLERSLARAPAAHPDLRGWALHAAAHFAMRLGDTPHQVALEEQSKDLLPLRLQLARERGDRRTEAWLLFEQGKHEEALAIFRELGDHPSIAYVLRIRSDEAYDREDYAAACAGLEEVLALDRARGAAPTAAAYPLLSLGQIALFQGQHDTARAHLEQSVALYHEMGHRTVAPVALAWLSWVPYNQGDLGEAKALQQQALREFREADHPIGIARSLAFLGRIALREGDAGVARSLSEEAREMYRRVHDPDGHALSEQPWGSL